jgi:DNA polymerase III subunit gamma/tau
MHLTQNSQVIGVEGNTLTLGFSNAGARDSFVGGGCDEILRQAAIDVAGVDWKVEAIVDPGTGGQGRGDEPSGPPPPPEPPEEPRAEESRPESSAAAREAIRGTRPAGTTRDDDERPRAEADAAAHPDDPDAEASGLQGAELLQRELGAQVIEEIRHP